MANTSVKAYARSKGVYLYEIANKMGIAEFTLTRRLRKEFSETEASKARTIIDEIAAEKWGEPNE